MTFLLYTESLFFYLQRFSISDACGYRYEKAWKNKPLISDISVEGFKSFVKADTN